MNAPLREPSFRESVDLMFNRAVRLMDLSPGLEEKILEQVRSTTKLIDRLHQKRRRGGATK